MSSESGPLLGTAEPLRQLGTTEFRLTSKDGLQRPFRFSPDGKLLTGANGDEVRIWTFPDCKLHQDFSDQIFTRCIGFSADGGEFLAHEQREMAIYRFDVESGELLAKIPLEEIPKQTLLRRFAMSEDGRWLLSNGGAFTVWDTSTGKLQMRQQPESIGSFYGIRVTKTGILTVWDNLFLERHNLLSGERLSRTRIYRRLISPVSNPEGTLLACYSTEDEAVIFWDPATNDPVGGKIPSTERAWQSSQAAISADGRRFVYWIEGGKNITQRKMAIFDVEDGTLITSFDPPDFYSLNEPLISPDGRFVFPTGGRSAFTPINVETGEPWQVVDGHSLAIESLSFTPDGKTLVVGSREKRQAWDSETGKPGSIFENDFRNSHVRTVDNDRVIISGLPTGGLRLHIISTGVVERYYDRESLKYPSEFQLAPDRKSVVGIVPGFQARVLKRWDIETGNVVSEWQIPGNPHSMEQFHDRAYLGLALGGSRLYRFDQVKAPEKLPDGSFDWGHMDLILEDWAAQKVTHRLRFPDPNQFELADLASDHTLVAVASENWAVKNPYKNDIGSTYLLRWDLTTGEEVMRVERPREEYYAAFTVVAATSDARLLATVRYKNRIELWDGQTGELIQQLFAQNHVLTLAFSDDGTRLASGHQDGSVEIWDTRPAWELAVP